MSKLFEVFNSTFDSPPKEIQTPSGLIVRSGSTCGSVTNPE